MTLSKQAHENRYLLISLVVLLTLSNVPYGQYVLYPFELFSTWIHELCHGLAALAVGGQFEQLYIYSDTSGQAKTAIPTGSINRVIVSSAGYIGTTLFGALMLLLQRPTKFSKGVAAISAFSLLIMTLWKVDAWSGILFFLALIVFILVLAFVALPEEVGRIGTSAFGGLVLLSLLYARGFFTMLLVIAMGSALLAIGSKASKKTGMLTFSFLAATCGLNALTSIKTLFSPNLVVNGQASPSDAHAVASVLFGPYTIWAGLWLVFSVFVLGWALYRTLSAPIEEKEEAGKFADQLAKIDKLTI